MLKRENFEWCNTWVEYAENTDKPRILLIGDSISVGYRPEVNELMKDYYVDLLGTSRSINDPIYYNEINTAISQYDYQKIHFNNGLHGWHLSKDEYEQGLRKLISHLKKLTPKAIFYIATLTPVTQIDHTDILDERNKDVLDRNEVVIRLAKEFDLILDDLYLVVVGKPEYRSVDGYHYNDDGKKAQAIAIADLLK